MENVIRIYTDGAASGNPGPGGFGIVLLFGSKKKELSHGFRLTTNNRMELLAVIVALESLKSEAYPVVVYSDSKYVTEAVNQGWVFAWEKKQFHNKANVDLWLRFLPVYRKYKPKFVWVKGHAENIFNNRCDELAVAASKNKDLGIDAAFERMKESEASRLGF
jgi:ribonuclease HI